jgi:2-keto-4-pentenoate hydratase
MTTSTSLDRAVDRLENAAADGIACLPVRDLVGSDDIAAAYRVQSELIARRLQRGVARVGRKIGLTSAAVAGSHRGRVR